MCKLATSKKTILATPLPLPASTPNFFQKHAFFIPVLDINQTKKLIPSLALLRNKTNAPSILGFVDQTSLVLSNQN
jgi:hypothetical protein